MPQSLHPSSSSARVSRPAYLVAALMLASMLGLGGMTNGCGTLQFYKQHTLPALPTDSRMDPELRTWVEAVHEARNEALVSLSGRLVPLATANMLLSFLLIVAAASAMAGRPRAHSLALQAIFANLAFAVVAYVLEHPLRGAIIDAATRAPPDTVNLSERLPTEWGWVWAYRSMLGMQLLALALIAYALTRPRVMAFFKREPELEQDV